VALEVMTNRLSTPDALVELVEDVLESPAAGVCLDVGHARLLGDPVDAIEAASGHIIAAHVHDTRGARDEHLVPYDGSIDWTRTLLAFQKVGYTGPWTFELAPGPPAAILARAALARQRFEQRLGINDELMSQ
jgi:sugar phosphate isomerase/epimerase